MALADTTADRPLLDLSDPRFLADPYPFYRLLRERAPVWRSAKGWVLSRHADVAAVLKDPRFGHDFEGKLSDPRERSDAGSTSAHAAGIRRRESASSPEAGEPGWSGPRET